ncbi:MAG: hypothetical protein QM724_05410 [Flavobacteriales bacterium]
MKRVILTGVLLACSFIAKAQEEIYKSDSITAYGEFFKGIAEIQIYREDGRSNAIMSLVVIKYNNGSKDTILRTQRITDYWNCEYYRGITSKEKVAYFGLCLEKEGQVFVLGTTLNYHSSFLFHHLTLLEKP